MLRIIVAANLMVAAWGQGAAPAFEVATVKPAAAGLVGWTGFDFPGGGRLNTSRVSLQAMIAFAYGIRDFQVSGGPGWCASAMFDIAAKADESVTPAQMKAMLQTLLADRFQLVLRHEMKETPVYELVLVKSGLKLRENGVTPKAIIFRGKGQIEGQMASLSMLASFLSNQLGRTVLDKTGLTAVYDFTLKWTPDESESGPKWPDTAPQPDPNGPSIFTAVQEQLGLKLEAQKRPMQTLVIDRAERPSEN